MSGVMYDKILGRLREGDDGGGEGEVFPSKIYAVANISDIDSAILNVLNNGDCVVDSTVDGVNDIKRSYFVFMMMDGTASRIELVNINDSYVHVVSYYKSGNVWYYNGTSNTIINNRAEKIYFQSILPQNGMKPNRLYNLGELSANTTFALAAAIDNTIANEWHWTFSTGATAPTITWPQEITMWAGGTAPTIEANTYYEISVMNGLAVVVSAAVPQSNE